MSYRTFQDASGEEWQAWDVFPSTDVRHTLQGGWLTFQSATEKRRLAPVPLYWVSADEAELRRLLESAKPAPERTGARAEMPEETPDLIPPGL
jgi:hypothetical protein